MPPSKQILLVDDNPLVLEMMGRALSKEGFECLKATSAHDAMELLKHTKPDVILSDYHMPDVNGFQFRQQLISMPQHRDIPFMFLTSEVNDDLMLEGIKLDAVDYILKNTPVPVVVSKINNFLTSVREQHERTLKELSREAQALNLNNVPKQVPQIHGFQLDFWHKPFQNYPGGDFIDFIKISDRYTFVVLGDVMGKKWGAWFFSFGFLSYIRAAVRICIGEGNFSTRNILQKINNVVYHDPMVADVLSSLSLLQIDAEKSKISYSGAGDLPILFYNSNDHLTREVRSSGMLLGLMEDGDHDEIIIDMQPGDRVYILTDGMIDEETPQGKRTDYAAFAAAMLPYHTLTFAELKQSQLLKDKGEQQIDDCSLIIIQKTR